MQITEAITATAIETVPEGLILVLDQRKVRIPWEKCSDLLATASEPQRLMAELSPCGYGIHWPLIDEDLSVPVLLKAGS